MKRKIRKKVKIPISVVTMILSILVSILIFVCAVIHVEILEQGVIDVCADQQDTYVELVMKQICLVENRTDAEMIEKIIATLDSSTNKYWTLSHNQELLFVKDILETNKFKGFTTSTYYESASAKNFLESLDVNRVKHGVIMIDDKKYIASGAVFIYQDREYKICLLTNKAVILDNNMFLQAKVSILTLLAMISMVFVLSSVGFSYRIEKERRRKRMLQAELVEAQYRLSIKNDDRYSAIKYDKANEVWAFKMLPVFVEKLQQKKCVPVTVVKIACKDRESADLFLTNAKDILEKKILRFRMSDTQILLLCIQCHRGDAAWSIVPAVDDEVVIEKIYEIKDSSDMNMLLILNKINTGDE